MLNLVQKWPCKKVSHVDLAERASAGIERSHITSNQNDRPKLEQGIYKVKVLQQQDWQKPVQRSASLPRMTLVYPNCSEAIILKGSPTGHSESSISRRKRKLGLKASHLTTLELDVNVKRQLILDQMAKDPKGRLGARMVKQGILRDTGIHLTRDYIRDEMRNLDPVGHAARGPAHVKAKRQQKQLEVQANCTIQPPESLSDVSHTPTQAISSDLPSSTTRYQLHAIPLPPVPHSPMNLDEDSNSNGTNLHFNPEIPDQLSVLTPRNVNPAPDTLPPEPSRTVTSPSITAALDILRDIAPQMSAVTRMLDTVDMNVEALDVEALGLVTGGMEAAALLERQLARVASKARCY